MRTSLWRQRASNVPNLWGTKHNRVHLCSTINFHYGEDFFLCRLCWNWTVREQKAPVAGTAHHDNLYQTCKVIKNPLCCNRHVGQVAIGSVYYVIMFFWSFQQHLGKGGSLEKIHFLWWCYVAFWGCAPGSNSWVQGCTEKWPKPPCRISEATWLIFPVYYQRRR